ncbi:MAG: hypothetical protein V2B20_05320 [Pseudomonadota bacterium]
MSAQQFDELIKEIKLFVRYAVPDNELRAALAMVDRYRHDRLILNLLREYYVALPDAREEAVIRISRLIRRQGVCLFVAITTSTAHLYAVSVDEAVWLGEYLQELDSEFLDFWGFSNHEEFSKICLPIGDLEDCAGDPGGTTRECPACGVEEGELHLLGCSVEVCPWCEGQLNKCNCRFEQLEVDMVDNEEQLERFLDLLMAKGRIPFQQHQAPYYPGTSSGLDRDEKEES